MQQQRVAREAEEFRKQQRAVWQAKLRLGTLHANRALLLWCGVRPWRTLVARRQKLEEISRAHYRCSVARPVLAALAFEARRGGARRAAAGAVLTIYTQKQLRRCMLRSGLVRLSAGAERARARLHAVRYVLSQPLLRRVSADWAGERDGRAVGLAVRVELVLVGGVGWGSAGRARCVGEEG